MPAWFEHQVAIATGGAAGIGHAIVQRLADDGATVVVADINEKDGREVAKAIGTEKAVSSIWTSSTNRRPMLRWQLRLSALAASTSL
jgi:NAD(P)-dependent dehydrogenase (short-subunit alcohol dehydrogenase family)